MPWDSQGIFIWYNRFQNQVGNSNSSKINSTSNSHLRKKDFGKKEFIIAKAGTANQFVRTYIFPSKIG